ncbi:MAG: hypothetical protein L0H24_14000, partial [Microlunatus sp.]|nr:hypothetical protein [Microlunatus sp.]
MLFAADTVVSTAEPHDDLLALLDGFVGAVGLSTVPGAGSEVAGSGCSPDVFAFLSGAVSADPARAVTDPDASGLGDADAVGVADAAGVADAVGSAAELAGGVIVGPAVAEGFFGLCFSVLGWGFSVLG